MQNTVTLTKFEHALIVALALRTPKLMRKGDCVSVQFTDEQRELIAGTLREFMGSLTPKILGPAPSGAPSNFRGSDIAPRIGLLADDLSETTLPQCRTQSTAKRSAPKRSFQRATKSWPKRLIDLFVANN
jgi:hypothetical protein